MLLTDSTFTQLNVGISTSLEAENSTSFLIQNTVFKDCGVAIQDTQLSETLVAGSSGSVTLGSWGFGNLIQGNSSIANFQSGNDILEANRTASLLDGTTNNFFTRNAPTYQSLTASSIINIKSQGAAGDGVTDDTAIINQILVLAANSSSVVFFPFGIYNVKNTITIPVGFKNHWTSLVTDYGHRFKL